MKPDLTIPNYPDIYVVGDLASAVASGGEAVAGIGSGGGDEEEFVINRLSEGTKRFR